MCLMHLWWLPYRRIAPVLVINYLGCSFTSSLVNGNILFIYVIVIFNNCCLIIIYVSLHNALYDFVFIHRNISFIYFTIYIINMLKCVYFELNILYTCLFCFSISNTTYSKTNNFIFDLLFDIFISNNSLHIPGDYFYKMHITVPTHIFITPSCSFCWGLELAYFWIFFEDHIKRSGNWENPKTAIFDLPEPLN